LAASRIAIFFIHYIDQMLCLDALNEACMCVNNLDVAANLNALINEVCFQQQQQSYATLLKDLLQ